MGQVSEQNVFEGAVEQAGLPVPVASLEAITRGEVMSQVDIANRYPRSLTAFRDKSVSMATLTQDIAERCFYKLKRKSADGTDRFIEGPSVRLAEIAAACYRNVRYGGRIVDTTATQVVAQGFAHDLEANNACTVEVRRRITDRKGRRFSDDMVTVTGNAAIAIAIRNALFKIIPAALMTPAYDAARRVAVGDAKTLGERRGRMLASFAQLRVTPEMVVAYLERPSVEDISLDDLETLIGVYNAIRDGDTTVDEAFHQEKPAIEMPKSNAEAKANGSPAAPAGTPGTAEAVSGGPAAAGDVLSDTDANAPSQKEQEAIRAQEQAEAAQQAPAPQTVDRGAVFNAVLRLAKKENKQAAEVLKALTGKGSLAALDDAGVAELAKKLNG